MGFALAQVAQCLLRNGIGQHFHHPTPRLEDRDMEDDPEDWFHVFCKDYGSDIYIIKDYYYDATYEITSSRLEDPSFDLIQWFIHQSTQSPITSADGVGSGFDTPVDRSQSQSFTIPPKASELEEEVFQLVSRTLQRCEPYPGDSHISGMPYRFVVKQYTPSTVCREKTFSIIDRFRNFEILLPFSWLLERSFHLPYWVATQLRNECAGQSGSYISMGHWNNIHYGSIEQYPSPRLVEQAIESLLNSYSPYKEDSRYPGLAQCPDRFTLEFNLSDTIIVHDKYWTLVSLTVN
ncbi:hypothetical protein BDQ17DRAFT_1419735 [Cyathus striatus]|nr:hypothetical protein BDQ17DRAFT_1419735 [Cyathus striatus]